jgi:hypothetical protein
MKKFLLVLFVLFMTIVVVNRQRVFVRDPLGSVERHGARIARARVFINYSNDVLIEDPERNEHYLVQEWNKVPGVPKSLNCLKGMVCWTESDHAESVPLAVADYHPKVAMSNREVTFVDDQGEPFKVTLR